MKLPPGVPVLLKTVIALSLPPVALLTLNNFANSQFGIVVPTWLLWALCLTSAPFIITCVVWYNILHEKYRIWKLGAQPLPKLKGKWFGGIDIIVNAYKDQKEGYFSMCVSIWFALTLIPFVAAEILWDGTENLGSSFDTYALWDHDFVTCNPEVIKVSFRLSVCLVLHLTMFTFTRPS